jgi:hypothetical protein
MKSNKTLFWFEPATFFITVGSVMGFLLRDLVAMLLTIVTWHRYRLARISDGLSTPVFLTLREIAAR